MNPTVNGPEGTNGVVTVKVTTELLAQLTEWSEPVEVKIDQAANGEYTMVFRRAS